MAATFILGPEKSNGLASIYIRVQDFKSKLQIKQSTGLLISPKVWAKRNDEKYSDKFKKDSDVAFALNAVNEIRLTINESFESGKILNKDEVRSIVHDIVYREQIEKEQRILEERQRLDEEKNKMTLNKFITEFITEIEDGTRQTESGRNYSPSTIKCIKHGMTIFKKFERSAGVMYDFEDIDLKMYNKYTSWLRKQEYNINSIGKYVQQLKMILDVSFSEGYHANTIWKDKRFKGKRIDVDSIYLTKEDLAKLKSVDLSNYSEGYSQALDIFMVGVWTAQRVSDYNNIGKEDISTYTTREIVDEPDPNDSNKTIAKIVTREITVINIRQQKTGAKVTIPCSSELVEILKKYNYEIPHLEDQVINRYIKEIAKAAGLTELIEIETTKGGVSKMERIPKYDLIMTHTARRTGATLMYLSGMEIYDIMKITGHSTPAMLKKYIKADQLEVVDKIVKKYNYFD